MLRLFLQSFSLYLYFFIIIYGYKGLAEAIDIFTFQLKLPQQMGLFLVLRR